MTTGTGTSLPCHSIVIKSRKPITGIKVAYFAFLISNYMSGTFAGSPDAVMTKRATAWRFGVIKPRYGQPGLRIVTTFATVTGGEMLSIHSSGQNSIVT